MFENLTDKLSLAFKKLKGHGKLNEKNIEAGLKDVRLALLEADVHYKVVKELIASIRERAIGQEVMDSLTPGQQVVKIVNEELAQLMGSNHEELCLTGSQPAVIMLVGLQGSGKTTTAGKLAGFLMGQHRKPYLVPADPYRPAAIEQLKRIGNQVGADVFAATQDMDPVDICRDAFQMARQGGFDTILIDTAGRLHVDEQLMAELIRIKETVHPSDILLVSDAMTGQDAVNMAKAFNDALDIGGVILTKMEGDARGGAAISIKAITSKPIKFIGVGEKLDALEPFHPDRMASRILGMGDMIGLIERAEETIDEETVRQQTERLLSGEFTLEDFSKQISQVMKMGSIGKLMGMLPGEFGKMSQSVDPQEAEKKVRTSQAVIQSMTPAERQNPKILNASRRKRIAAGSGTQVYDVNQLVKQYRDAQKLFKQLKKSGLGNMPRFS